MADDQHTEIDSDDSEPAMEKPWTFAGLIVAVVVLWLISWRLIAANIKSTDDRGTFGDMFGAINSLFSGLAFACLVYAIILQRRELALQRNELKLSRKEFAAQTNELAENNKLLAE
jgi:hypothetical protein